MIATHAKYLYGGRYLGCLLWWN